MIAKIEGPSVDQMSRHKLVREVKRLKAREAHLEAVVAGLQGVMRKNDLLARVEKLEAMAGLKKK